MTIKKEENTIEIIFKTNGKTEKLVTQSNKVRKRQSLIFQIINTYTY